jgi:hypothetical protein
MRRTHASIVTGDGGTRIEPGLIVEPVRVGRHRSVGSLVVVAAVSACLGLAVAKPWAKAPEPDVGVDARFARAEPSSVLAVTADTPSSEPRAFRNRTVDQAALARLRSVGRATRMADWGRMARDLDHLAGEPIVSDRDLGGTDGDGTCGGSARITPFDELIGLVTPPGDRIADVRLHAIDTIDHRDVPIRIRPDKPGPLDGRTAGAVTIVELPPGGLAPREYALIAEVAGPAGPRPLRYTICVG